MKGITRFRIVLFALMIFGAFANFSLNEWGNKMIVVCEILMAISFITEVALTYFTRIKEGYRKKMSIFIFSSISTFFGILVLIILGNYSDLMPIELLFSIFLILFLVILFSIILEALFDFIKKIENRFIYENLFLSLFFTALFFKNAAYPGAGMMIVSSIVFLFPYFITTTIKFFATNYKSGKMLITLLTLGSLATVLLGLTFMFKTMHWPFASILFFISIALTLVLIIGSCKWNYQLNGKKVNIIDGLRLFKTNIIFLFFMLLINISYKSFVVLNIAPDFYSSDYPKNYYLLKNGSTEEWHKAGDISSVYDDFLSKAEKNEFVK